MLPTRASRRGGRRSKLARWMRVTWRPQEARTLTSLRSPSEVQRPSQRDRKPNAHGVRLPVESRAKGLVLAGTGAVLLLPALEFTCGLVDRWIVEGI